MEKVIINRLKAIGIAMLVIVSIFIIESVRVLMVYEGMPRECVHAVIEARGGASDVIGTVRYWEAHGEEIVSDIEREYECEEYHRLLRESFAE